ncbi:DUF4232 domain-containing protein [Streptomyces sasae]|uniref:DUF4232 domain-containing protein n=1 Tax=Streptomyces sasae TaxID=1266772 RepID=UPI00292EA48D|nr:DUF4232 domain-containing protein [Streptomyces sasae]
MTHRRAVPAALACCAALAAALTGCTSTGTGSAAGGSPAPSNSGIPSPATGSGSADAGTASPVDGPTPAASAAQAPTRCHSSELRVSIGPDHPGAGQENFAVILTNGSHRTCTMYGFPGVAFVNSAGEAVTPDPERTTGQEQRIVTLAPGASAWSALVFTNPAISGVTTVTPAAVLVTPPDETDPVRVRWTGGKVSNTGKASVPQVSPVRPGDGS